MGEEGTINPWDLQIYGAIVTHQNRAQWERLIEMRGSGMVLQALEVIAEQGGKAWLADVAQICLRASMRRHNNDKDVLYE